MTTRRDFLTTLSLALGATTLGRVRALDARTTSAKLPHIGIQLYTVRSLMAKDVEGTLAALAQIGYDQVEFAGYFNRTPTQIKAALAANKMRSPSTHMGFPTTDDAWKKSVDDAKAYGHDWIVIAWLDAAQRPTGAGWDKLAERYNALGAMAKAGGLKFAYHNHDFELVPAMTGTALDTLIAKTDPALVSFEMDLYWVVKGGADPLDLIKRYPHRFPLMHVKDATAAPARAMVDVGSGTIDFAKIFAQQKTSGMTNIFVEHDEPKDALASARNSYKHLAALQY